VRFLLVCLCRDHIQPLVRTRCRLQRRPSRSPRAPMPRCRDLALLGSPGLTAALCLRRLPPSSSSAPFRADWRLPQGFPKTSPPSDISSRISVLRALREAARELWAPGCLLPHVRLRGSSPPWRFDPPAGLRACCVPLPTLGFIGFRWCCRLALCVTPRPRRCHTLQSFPRLCSRSPVTRGRYPLAVRRMHPVLPGLRDLKALLHTAVRCAPDRCRPAPPAALLGFPRTEHTALIACSPPQAASADLDPSEGPTCRAGGVWPPREGPVPSLPPGFPAQLTFVLRPRVLPHVRSQP